MADCTVGSSRLSVINVESRDTLPPSSGSGLSVGHILGSEKLEKETPEYTLFKLDSHVCGTQLLRASVMVK